MQDAFIAVGAFCARVNTGKLRFYSSFVTHRGYRHAQSPVGLSIIARNLLKELRCIWKFSPISPTLNSSGMNLFQQNHVQTPCVIHGGISSGSFLMHSHKNNDLKNVVTENNGKGPT